MSLARSSSLAPQGAAALLAWGVSSLIVWLLPGDVPVNILLRQVHRSQAVLFTQLNFKELRMLKRLVTWTGCLTWCAMAALTVAADDAKPAAETKAVDEAQPAETKPEEAKPAAEVKAPPVTRPIGDLPWHTDYSAAYRQAKDEHKQLLMFFRDEKDLLTAGQLEQNVLAKPELKEVLEKFVRVMLPTTTLAPRAKDAKPEDKPVALLEYTAFAHMQKQAGLAILDLMDEKDHLFGKVVSAHPFSSNTITNDSGVRIMLGLPRGTITQRTLTYVLRTHPEQPASVWGKGDLILCEQCRIAAQLMANYGSVGHHDWGNRSAFVGGQFGTSPMEVASIGGGATLFEAASSAVNVWRGSGVHWGMMITPNRFFGYDMVQAPNGTWFANGIFVP